MAKKFKPLTLTSLALVLTALLTPSISFAAAPYPAYSNIPGLKVAQVTLARTHILTPGGYDLTKAIPMGGAHNPHWAACQGYTTYVAPEYAIHSMEHGAVWIAYDPKLSSKAINSLLALTIKNTVLLVTPVPHAPNPITVTAWAHQITATSANDPRIAQFIKIYQLGPQTPELGVPCRQGGVTDPKILQSPKNFPGGMGM